MGFAKIWKPKYGICLVSSMVLNLLLIGYLLFVGTKWNWELSWSMRAAMEAEAVASELCSGHGRAYLDGLVVDGKPVCECNTCFGGPDCSLFSPGCAADVDSGNPLFLEPFWMQNAASSAVLVAGWHRMGYQVNDQAHISTELEKHIRKLHSVVGNAVTEKRFIVFGAGSSQLLNAAVHALSQDKSTSPAGVVAYKAQTEFFRSNDYKFLGDAALWKNASDANVNIIEFVTSPNNPDGHLMKAVVQGDYAKAIYDHANLWPHYTAIPAPADEDLMIFTLSKLTGHAGSRFGWALIKNEAIYQRMATYVYENSVGVSQDTQLVALKLLKVVLEGNGGDFFDFGSTTMRSRWETLSEALSVSNRFSIQEIEPRYCRFFRQVRVTSPAFAWLKCERDEDKDCYSVLKTAGIIGRQGTVFGGGSRYVRLSLIATQDDFDLLMSKINTLVSDECVDSKLVEDHNQPICVDYKLIMNHTL
ncbi:Tryptophan aminotransferase-related protein [Actinidia chinensis var. chinensis]|uniref:Tryptophan aminotransferase-related protein n=1 Tax=Actinidia chinensis var. chinensis TaxID=1590841 RepID=A0A2R6R2P4_ACTCC|nr:Tryptophan aminotransferase-related protein [Actinidia chinensis var. chinensis]